MNSDTPRTKECWDSEWKLHYASDGKSSVAQGMADLSEELEKELTAARATIARLEGEKADITSDYLRRHNDAMDKFEEAMALEIQLAAKESELQALKQPLLQRCHNCDTPVPPGCSGLFRHETECLLNASPRVY